MGGTPLFGAGCVGAAGGAGVGAFAGNGGAAAIDAGGLLSLFHTAICPAELVPTIVLLSVNL
jgi:hypothetical protein